MDHPVRMHALRILFAVLLLAPSAWLAWNHRDLAHLGSMHDDGIYYTSAKSIADGSGYRILSLPGQPFQTKYPPLYPAYLSLAWILEPRFPANLPLAMLLSWLLVPALLALCWRLLPSLGITGAQRTGMMVFLALHPFLCWLEVQLMSEVFGTVVLLLSLWMVERKQYAAAGACAGLAYLARSSFIGLLVAIPLALLWRDRQRIREAALYLASAAPFLIGWQAWVKLHQTPTTDPDLLYYTNYLGLWARNLNPEQLGAMLYQNLSTFLVSAGQLIIFNLADNGLTVNASRLIGIVAILGLARIARNQGAPHPWILFGAFYAAVLLIWNYPPDARFVTPLTPLLAAGFLTETTFFVDLLRKTWRSPKSPGERPVAAMLGAVLASIVILGVQQNLSAAFVQFPQRNRMQAEAARKSLAAYQWVTQHTPASAKFFAYQDPLFYLHTGRTASRLPFPAWMLYQQDDLGIVRYCTNLEGFATRRGLGYLFLNQGEIEWNLKEADRLALWNRLHRELPPPLYKASGVSIFETPRLQSGHADPPSQPPLAGRSQRTLQR